MLRYSLRVRECELRRPYDAFFVRGVCVFPRNLSCFFSSFINLFYIFQEAIPIRLKQVHVINAPAYIGKLFAICKPFLKAEVAKLVWYIHIILVDIKESYKKKVYYTEDRFCIKIFMNSLPEVTYNFSEFSNVSDKFSFFSLNFFFNTSYSSFLFHNRIFV